MFVRQSEEDLKLKDTLELLVLRVQDVDLAVQKTALISMRVEIRYPRMALLFVSSGMIVMHFYSLRVQIIYKLDDKCAQAAKVFAPPLSPA